MKNMYLVTLKVTDRNALADVVDAVSGNATVEIMTVGNEKPREQLTPDVTPRLRRLKRAPRKMRGSKVNAAILNAMSDAPASIATMKAALEKAGMSAGSLSTGLAQLTKAGQIERVGEGLYGLKIAKAAE